MKVYRISKRTYIEDLSGEGARIYGGRWNPKGTPVVYTSENRALATVEFLVHVPMSLVPKDIFIAEIQLPPETVLEQIDTQSLPDTWWKSPPSTELTHKTSDWFKKNRSLVLGVPSAVVHGEWNILINPNHELANKIRITSIEPVRFDDRLIKG